MIFLVVMNCHQFVKILLLNVFHVTKDAIIKKLKQALIRILFYGTRHLLIFTCQYLKKTILSKFCSNKQFMLYGT